MKRKISVLRFLIQLTFGVLMAGVFSGFHPNSLAANLFNAMAPIQSAAKLYAYGITPFAWVTFGLLMTSLVLGRFYCSYLCPAGFLQDLVFRVRRIFFRNRKGPGSWPRTFEVLRFFCFVLVVSLIVGGIPAYQYLDHSSNLGKLFSWTSTGIVFLVILVISSMFFSRWFCNALCPSGTLFSLFHRVAPFRVKRTGNSAAQSCGGCTLCRRECPSSCIDQEGAVVTERCIQCLECLELCPRGRYGLSVKPQHNPSRERRQFLANCASSVFGIAAVATLGPVMKRVLLPTPAYGQSVLPPGALSEEMFYSRCVSCSLCIVSCPSHVLAFRNGYPAMNFERFFCGYECNACLRVCPVGALKDEPLEQKKRIKIGTSELNRDLCIPISKHRDCGACAEHCPTGAITTRPESGTLVPVLDEKKCVGCGACEYICPTRPSRAIRVQALAVHVQADPPGVRKRPQKSGQPPSGTFPF